LDAKIERHGNCERLLSPFVALPSRTGFDLDELRGQMNGGGFHFEMMTVIFWEKLRRNEIVWKKNGFSAWHEDQQR
jgi:hypothetical protein